MTLEQQWDNFLQWAKTARADLWQRLSWGFNGSWFDRLDVMKRIEARQETPADLAKLPTSAPSPQFALYTGKPTPTPTPTATADRSASVRDLEKQVQQLKFANEDLRHKNELLEAQVARDNANFEARASERAMEIMAALGVPPLKKDTWVEASEKPLLQQWEEEQDPGKKEKLWKQIKGALKMPDKDPIMIL